MLYSLQLKLGNARADNSLSTLLRNRPQRLSRLYLFTVSKGRHNTR